MDLEGVVRNALQLAYRKSILGDESISHHELSEALEMALIVKMRKDKYTEWHNNQNEG